jgi:hypothetical protein
MTCTSKSQHNFFFKKFYAKTSLPIFLVPHLKIFPTKNNIFIWKIKEARQIEKAEKILTKHADTQQDVLADNFVTYFHVGQIVESPLIFHKTQNLSKNNFIKLDAFTQLVCHNGGALDLHPQLGNWVFITSFSHHCVNIVNHGQLKKKQKLHI